MFLVVRPPGTLFLPPSIVTKWRGLRGLDARRRVRDVLLLRPGLELHQRLAVVLAQRRAKAGHELREVRDLKSTHFQRDAGTLLE